MQNYELLNGGEASSAAAAAEVLRTKASLYSLKTASGVRPRIDRFGACSSLCSLTTASGVRPRIDRFGACSSLYSLTTASGFRPVLRRFFIAYDQRCFFRAKQ